MNGETTRRCPVCGAPLQENARFCTHCMTSLDTKQPVFPLPRRRSFARTAAIMLSLLCVSLAMKMPAKPAKPAEPAAPEKPAEPGKSAEPAKPAQPAPAPEEPQAAPQEPPIVLADPQPTVLVEEIPVPQSPAGEHGTENP